MSSSYVPIKRRKYVVGSRSKQSEYNVVNYRNVRSSSSRKSFSEKALQRIRDQDAGMERKPKEAARAAVTDTLRMKYHINIRNVSRQDQKILVDDVIHAYKKRSKSIRKDPIPERRKREIVKDVVGRIGRGELGFGGYVHARAETRKVIRKRHPTPVTYKDFVDIMGRVVGRAEGKPRRKKKKRDYV